MYCARKSARRTRQVKRQNGIVQCVLCVYVDGTRVYWTASERYVPRCFKIARRIASRDASREPSQRRAHADVARRLMPHRARHLAVRTCAQPPKSGEAVTLSRGQTFLGIDGGGFRMSAHGRARGRGWRADPPCAAKLTPALSTLPGHRRAYLSICKVLRHALPTGRARVRGGVRLLN